jgi:hypothetical protein
VLGAKHIVQCLKAREEVRAILTQMEGVATALINLAYYEVQGKSKCELWKCLICSVIKYFFTYVYHAWIYINPSAWLIVYVSYISCINFSISNSEDPPKAAERE